MALVENIQRENLNPIEMARAFQRLAHAVYFGKKFGPAVLKRIHERQGREDFQLRESE